jgi:DNA-binding response OmpR family regulator
MIQTTGSTNCLALPTILVIEASNAYDSSIRNMLGSTRMPVIHAATGAQGLALERSERPDVVVVDLELPNTDGLKLIAQLRRQSHCGIIIISDACEPADRVVGLEIGADHYVGRPPPLRELVGRIRAVSRRITAAPVLAATEGEATQLGKLSVDIRNRSLQSQDGNRIPLTAAEFDVFGTMWAANGTPVSRDRLSEAALRRPWRNEDRTVDQLILGLRQKLAHFDDRNFIHTVRGQGYLLAVTT